MKHLSLVNLSTSHQDGPFLLNVSRHLDMLQALSLAFPRAVTLRIGKPEDKKSWDWTQRLAKAIGAESSLEIK